MKDNLKWNNCASRISFQQKNAWSNNDGIVYHFEKFKFKNWNTFKGVDDMILFNFIFIFLYNNVSNLIYFSIIFLNATSTIYRN